MKIEYKGDEIIISDFKPIEAYKIARRLEAEGINFYSLFLSATPADSAEKNRAVQKAVESLLAEEKKHLKLFNQKIEELAGPFEESGIVDDIDTKVFGSFGEPVDLAAIVKERKKAIELGILFEKRSINFFGICRDRTSGAPAKKAFEDIIREEERHLGLLKEMLNK